VPEGVGDALRRIHRALRPGGVLLDVHPRPEPVGYEVRTGGRAVPVGENRAPQAIEKVPRARAALAAAIAGGWFVRERRASFTFARHFAGVETMLAYYRARDPDVTLDDALLARARALLAANEGTVVSLIPVHAERLRRSEPRGADEGSER
jgi:SAM-dependent methyltransferase